MASYQNQIDGWSPPCARIEHARSIYVIASLPGGLTRRWLRGPGNVFAEDARTFLGDRLQRLPAAELSAEVTFVYVVFRRTRRADDDIRVIGPETAIAEFGYGSPPASPEEWPTVSLKELLEYGSIQLPV